MPELPEVETIRTQLASDIEGSKIFDSGSHWSKKFTQAKKLDGATLGKMGRRGKFLITPTTGDNELIVHLGMTGKLRLQKDREFDDYTRAWWGLVSTKDKKTTLEFNDVRRFGRIYVTEAGNYSNIGALASMGPEPWDDSLDDNGFWNLLKKSSRYIKTQLLSQKPIAGVGNIYADEALWEARIYPKSRVLTKKQAGDLLLAIRNVLDKGIRNGGTTLKDYVDADGNTGRNQTQLFAYGRAGDFCDRCDAIMVSQQLDARTTTWCPICQTS